MLSSLLFSETQMITWEEGAERREGGGLDSFTLSACVRATASCSLSTRNSNSWGYPSFPLCSTSSPHVVSFQRLNGNDKTLTGQPNLSGFPGSPEISKGWVIYASWGMQGSSEAALQEVAAERAHQDWTSWNKEATVGSRGGVGRGGG